MNKPDIEIICPNCNQKAVFFSNEKIGNYVQKPSLQGKVICAGCGLNKSMTINNEMYYFKIPVGNRYLYARTFENLEILKSYFKENKRIQDSPELDFPKEFYKNRLEIIEKIEKKIEQENNLNN